MPVQRKPLIWKDPGGPRFTCPICGAVYAVEVLGPGAYDRDYVRCLGCGTQMDDWADPVSREYTLIAEPKAAPSR